MLNFLGALSSLLPGYIQGRRQAIQDNWQDLQNYNNVQAGQLSNAFTEATWQPRLDMFADSAINSGLNVWNNGMNTAIRAAYFPGQYYQGNIWSGFAPGEAYRNGWMKMMADNWAMRNPGFTMGQGLNPAPSSTQQIGG